MNLVPFPPSLPNTASLNSTFSQQSSALEKECLQLHVLIWWYSFKRPPICREHTHKAWGSVKQNLWGRKHMKSLGIQEIERMGVKRKQANSETDGLAHNKKSALVLFRIKLDLSLVLSRPLSPATGLTRIRLLVPWLAIVVFLAEVTGSCHVSSKTPTKNIAKSSGQLKLVTSFKEILWWHNPPLCLRQVRGRQSQGKLLYF